MQRTFHHTRAQECPLPSWECSQMGLLGGSNPWPWPFGTTTPSTSAVGRHPDTSDTSDTQTLDTQTRSDTTHASQLSRALRHRLDTGQTPLTLLTPVSIDTAQTRLRHCSDTPDTSDTQTQQGSRPACPVRFRASTRPHARTLARTPEGPGAHRGESAAAAAPRAPTSSSCSSHV